MGMQEIFLFYLSIFVESCRIDFFSVLQRSKNGKKIAAHYVFQENCVRFPFRESSG